MSNSSLNIQENRASVSLTLLSDSQPTKVDKGLRIEIPKNQNFPISDFRHVFQTSEQMKVEFVKFLRTIFYQLDERKVLALMEKILKDPRKTDEQIYCELLQNIHSTKKTFSIFHQLWSLSVLKTGMGQQVAQLMKGFNKTEFHDYMEVYDRRYVDVIRRIAKLPLDGNIAAVCDSPETVGFADRIQAGALFSSYPYQQQYRLNDADCVNPGLFPEKSYQPLPNQVEDLSVDLIGCLGGLHHIPTDRIEPFIDSLHCKLRPGGVILLREHDIAGQDPANHLDIRTIAGMVHTFVNAANGVSWEEEKREVREFDSEEAWTDLMKRHGFQRISSKSLILKDDPTGNAMFAFIKKPETLEELRNTIKYRNDCTRPKEGTRATWIEWGNVRFSKQYAEYIQNHHAYTFDFIGHLRQHWKYFYYFIKECLADKELRFKDVLFSDNMLMNVFILTATTIQCSLSAVGSLPQILVARWKHGENWRNVSNLSALEKFEARYEKEYSSYIDHTPFYMFDYIGKIREMWKVVWNSEEKAGEKLVSVAGAMINTFGFLAKTIICAPIKAFYSAEANQEPDTIKILIKDPDNEIQDVIKQWESEKDEEYNKNHTIEVIHETSDGYKLVSMPRYRPFTQICGYLSETQNLEILEIGGQQEVSVDVLLDKQQLSLEVEGTRTIYEIQKLQDEQQRRYVVYQVNVAALKQFQQRMKRENIEYIHE